LDASPIGMLTTPGMPMRRTGTWGNAFANRNPDVLGRNPGTVVLGIAASSMTDEQYRVRGCLASPRLR
jgi:hypothetical protein